MQVPSHLKSRRGRFVAFGLGLLFSIWAIHSYFFNQGFSSVEEAASVFKVLYRKPDAIPFPKDNLFTQAKLELGKVLFYDPRLSGSQSMACVSCHNPSFSFENGIGKAVGNSHKILSRKVPTVLNLAWGQTFFWDGRAKTLEEQALGPIQHPDEMNLPLSVLEARLHSIDGYRKLFEAAFPGEPISAKNVAKAIATYERTIVSKPAAFDRWVEGEESAISDQAKSGFVLFNSTAKCVTCHSGWSFTNGSFADTGLLGSDTGRGKVESNPDVNHAFKTPTLRDVARRAPYMHDGSIQTLAEVIQHYNRGGSADRPTARLFVSPLGLDLEDVDNLMAFLSTLTSEKFDESVPELPVNSGKETKWTTTQNTERR